MLAKYVQPAALTPATNYISMDCMNSSYFLAVAVALLLLAAPASPSSAQERGQPPGACYDMGEIMGDMTYKFVFGQGIRALRCDQLIEGKAEPTAKILFNRHDEVFSTHKSKFLDMAAMLDPFFDRYSMDKSEYLSDTRITLILGLDDWRPSSSYCAALHAELLEQQKDWDKIFRQIMDELTVQYSEYSVCE